MNLLQHHLSMPINNNPSEQILICPKKCGIRYAFYGAQSHIQLIIIYAQHIMMPSPKRAQIKNKKQEKTNNMKNSENEWNKNHIINDMEIKNQN